MRILIVSDIHANREALAALPEDYDEMWVLGDLVNYGPDPAAALEFVRARAGLIVRGNHDHAAGFGVDPRCSARFRKMAEETGRLTASVLDEEQKRFLRELPLTAGREVDGLRFLLCHALPSDPLYPYCRSDSPRWKDEAASAGAAVLLAGHTHLPFRREFPGCVVLNPGSVGQPKHGCPQARYAVWENGALELRSVPYEWRRTAEKIRALPFSDDVKADLCAVLAAGAPPP